MALNRLKMKEGLVLNLHYGLTLYNTFNFTAVLQEVTSLTSKIDIIAFLKMTISLRLATGFVLLCENKADTETWLLFSAYSKMLLYDRCCMKAKHFDL